MKPMSDTSPALEAPAAHRPRGRPKAESLAAIEARIIAIAREQFFEFGYGATTMDNIAKAVRGSKTTLYTRFPTKDSLFRAIVAEQVDNWETGSKAVPVGHYKTLEEYLRAMADVYIRAGTSAEFAGLQRLIFGESQRFPELAQSFIAIGYETGIKTIAKSIGAFAEREGVACKDPTAAAELYSLLISGHVTNLVLLNRQTSARARKAWIANTVRMFLAGRASW